MLRDVVNIPTVRNVVPLRVLSSSGMLHDTISIHNRRDKIPAVKAQSAKLWIATPMLLYSGLLVRDV